jgi:hypothetical protein
MCRALVPLCPWDADHDREIELLRQPRQRRHFHLLRPLLCPLDPREEAERRPIDSVAAAKMSAPNQYAQPQPEYGGGMLVHDKRELSFNYN